MPVRACSALAGRRMERGECGVRGACDAVKIGIGGEVPSWFGIARALSAWSGVVLAHALRAGSGRLSCWDGKEKGILPSVGQSLQLGVLL